MRILKYLGLAVLLLVGGLVAFLATIDLNDYRDTIAREVETATGRKLRIEGDLAFQPSLVPTIAVEGVTLANAAWGKAPQLLKAGRLEARAALLPLLSRHVQVERILLRDVELWLETDAAGRGNWEFKAPEAAATPATEATTTVSVHGLSVEQARLHYLDGKSGKSTSLDITQLRVAARSRSQPLELELQAALDGKPLALEGRIGSLDSLLGSAGSPLELQAELSGWPELAAFSPLQLTALATAAAGGRQLTLANLQLAAGALQLSGELSLKRDGERPLVSGRLQSPLIDLGPAAEEKKKPEKLFSAAPLPLESLRTVDAEVDMAITEFRSGDNVLSELKLPLRLEAGRLSVTPFKFGIAGGHAEGRLDLNAAAKRPRSELDLRIRGMELGRLPALARRKSIEGGPTELTLSGTGSGASVAEIMAGLNGSLLIKVGPGKLAGKSVDLAGADLLLETFNQLNPLAKSEPGSQLECAVVNFAVKDGIASTDRGIAVQTTKMTLVGSGTVNLKSEQLDLGLRPSAREGTGIGLGSIAGAARIGGTLARPKPVIDAANVLKAGVSAGAGIATFGLSTLAQGMFDKQSADPQPCETALGRKPAQPAAAESKPQEKPKNPIESTTEAVKGVFKNLFGD